jgi:hypothetical protein
MTQNQINLQQLNFNYLNKLTARHEFIQNKAIKI